MVQYRQRENSLKKSQPDVNLVYFKSVKFIIRRWTTFQDFQVSTRDADVSRLISIHWHCWDGAQHTRSTSKGASLWTKGVGECRAHTRTKAPSFHVDQCHFIKVYSRLTVDFCAHSNGRQWPLCCQSPTLTWTGRWKSADAHECVDLLTDSVRNLIIPVHQLFLCSLFSFVVAYLYYSASFFRSIPSGRRGCDGSTI